MQINWSFFVCSVFVGLVGMLGVRFERKRCLILLAPALPGLFFAALWVRVPLIEISSYFCVIAFMTLCGLQKE